MSEANKNNIAEEPKTSKLAKASLALPVFVFVITLLQPLEVHPPPPPSIPKYILLFACFMIGLALAITSLMQITKSRGKLTGKTLAVCGIIINAFFCFMTVHTYVADYKGYIARNRLLCASNLHQLGMAMLLYASENDDKYPEADKWCDLIMPYIDDDHLFRCKGSDAIRGESSYAFNKNVADKKIAEIPSGIVVLFETNFGKHPAGRDSLLIERDCDELAEYAGVEDKVYKLRWNQAGGPELLTAENHKGNGCNVLLSDLDGLNVEFIESEDFKKLRWKVNDDLVKK